MQRAAMAVVCLPPIKGHDKMKDYRLAAAALAALMLASCSGDSAQEQEADKLEAAAEQSTPEAAAVLENAADRMEDGPGQNATAGQAALEAAGNAQVDGEANLQD